ncbi:hypothetical protein BO71DRAFT_436035 [Aspergillus ellipticus CBS 707.79]|uniref:ATPase AAA-type core domain-containing protein n=1 Tax=Aspergillus ellipticus CBS 707.79 TaxID=1448320 RepID=A0A319CSJ9_9EURO|nr:hypothetical protein BO71DRAFT_436035 [Aspergillus ellipticus CBS 707.79]
MPGMIPVCLRSVVFWGPPGTGKISVARRVGQILYHMGSLSTPEMIECSVSDLVASYLMDMLDRALGNVLFIDEAYRLAGGDYKRQFTAPWLTDEAIHLASVLFSGWLAQEPARSFSNRSVAKALHPAVLEVHKTERPGVWASFVHHRP